jgi:hypothetical protein
VSRKERVAQLPLHADDLAAVALESASGAGRAQDLSLTQKPSEVILEGFHRERITPARGGCGLRG